MEVVKTVEEIINLQACLESESTAISSTNIRPRKILRISREKITAMLAVLSKRWLSKAPETVSVSTVWRRRPPRA